MYFFSKQKQNYEENVKPERNAKKREAAVSISGSTNYKV